MLVLFEHYILRRVSEIDSVKRILIESRIEYITLERIEEIKSIIGKKKFEIAIGIESSNERIRNQIIKKGLSWEKLREKLLILKKTDTSLMGYVLIKPPTLTEEEAIDDAIQTCYDIVKLAEEVGVNVRLALEPTFVVKGTLLEEEYLAGKFKPINLWNVIKIIKKVHKLCNIFIGVSDERLIEKISVLGIDAYKVPISCRRCRLLLIGTIQEFNYTQNVNVFNKLYCGFCNDGWIDD